MFKPTNVHVHNLDLWKTIIMINVYFIQIFALTILWNLYVCLFILVSLITSPMKWPQTWTNIKFVLTLTVEVHLDSRQIFSPSLHYFIAFRARVNMQFEKVKKEIIKSKKRDFVQNHTFYSKKKERFSVVGKQ